MVNKRIKLKKYSKSEMIFYTLLISLPVIQVLIFYFGVNLNSFLLAFQKYDILNGTYSFVGFDNFKWAIEMFKDPIFFHSFKNSLIVYIFGYGITETLCIVISFYMFKHFFGGNVFRVILFMPSIVSAIVMTVIFKYFVERFIPETYYLITKKHIDGLLSGQKTVFSTLIFYSIWTGLGSSILLYAGSMNNINRALSESAQLDGVNNFQELIYIVFPLIWPTFVTFFITNLTGILSNQLGLYNFYQDRANSRLWTVGYFMFKETITGGKSQYASLSAMGLIFTCVLAPLTLILRWLMLRFGPKED